MDIRPYVESEKVGIQVTRLFSEQTPEEEFVWHRDQEDRVIEVLQPTNWKFQFDNQLPQKLTQGSMIYIPKNTYHRIIKGTKDFKIRITKYDINFNFLT
jgi:quercetin dioxygenase-like cupin family protein